MWDAMQLMLILLLTIGCVNCSISCKNNDNKPVDWFIIYKLPHHYKTPVPRNETFPPHLYMDSDNNEFYMSAKSLTEKDQALAYTLDQAYSNHNSSDVGYLMYNDEKPIQAGGKDSKAYGHTKGVVMFEKVSGVWLIHSTPKFPPPTKSYYTYPQTGILYGQHFLCSTLTAGSQISSVGEQLLYNHPQIYDSNLPDYVTTLYPIMATVVAGKKANSTNHRAVLKTSDEHPSLVSFAKTSKFGHDLYADLVAPSLKCNMSVETWQHEHCHGKEHLESENLPSACNKTFKVENIRSVQSNSFNINFSYFFDHSKFAICQRGAPWVCIGDINRQVHQQFRGGGTACLFNWSVWKQYIALVGGTESCP